MAEVKVLVCDVCGGSKEVHPARLSWSGRTNRSDLCIKCFTDMSKKYGFTESRRGWSRTEVVNFEDIPRNTP